MILLPQFTLVLWLLFWRWTLTQEYTGPDKIEWDFFSDGRIAECINYCGPYTATVDADFNIIQEGV